MNLQPLFDEAYLGVLKQGKIAVTPERLCQYLTADGCRCNVGQLIPMDYLRERALYLNAQGSVSKLVQGPHNMVWGILKEKAQVKNDEVDRFMSFLVFLQEAHDRSRSMDNYRIKMAALAEAYHLTVPSEKKEVNHG